jgi:hypothetical protein
VPAKSKDQKSAFSMALAARKDDLLVEGLKGAARHLYRDKSLSDSDLEDYASTKTRHLPKAVGHTNPTFKRA